jgi:integrase
VLRERGVSPVTVNTYLRHIKCFYLWKGTKWELPWLKEERKVLQTLSETQVKALVAFKPTGTNATRAHVAALAILDTGVRASELLGIMPDTIDWDSLVLKVHVNILRRHPFSFDKGDNGKKKARDSKDDSENDKPGVNELSKNETIHSGQNKNQ